jgi:hypothetical protein
MRPPANLTMATAGARTIETVTICQILVGERKREWGERGITNQSGSNGNSDDDDTQLFSVIKNVSTVQLPTNHHPNLFEMVHFR